MTAADIAPLVAVWVYIVVSAIFRLEPRVAVGIALGLLLASVIVLTVGREDWAGQLAIYFFYFMIAGLILILIQRARGSGEKDRGKTET